MDQKPSVGRTVHYVAFGSPGGEFPAGVCRAAIVTEVHVADVPSGEVDGDEIRRQLEGRWISLCVLNPSGLFFNQNVVYDPDRRPGTWHWPERV